MRNTSIASALRVAPFLGATTLSILKPLLRGTLAPVVRRLFEAGVTANQVTVASIVGSVAVGAMPLATDNPTLFLLLPVWLAARTAMASIDGTLAIQFGQKSRLGGFLNEGGDLISEAALWLPLATVLPAEAPWLLAAIALALLSEVAGWLGVVTGSGRHIEGPFGKADRSFVLGAIGLWIGVGGAFADHWVVPGFLVMIGLSLLTIINRLRFAAAAVLDIGVVGEGR